MGTRDHSTTTRTGHSRTGMTDVTPLLELTEKADLSEMYALLADNPMTVPELVSSLGVSKSTAYEYVEKLVAAGVISEVGERDSAAVYDSNDFEIVVSIEEAELRLTPELIRLVSERNSNDTIDRFIEQFGIETLAEVLEVAPAYADGALTHRIVADRLEIPRGWAFDILDEVLPFVVEDLPEAETLTPDDVDATERATLLEDDSDTTT